MLKPGEKLHIVERRYFADDVRRHFVGEVLESSIHAVRVAGHAWVYDRVAGAFVRREERRERVFALGDRLTVNVLPAAAKLEAVAYVDEGNRGLRVTDGAAFSLEVTEFSAQR